MDDRCESADHACVAEVLVSYDRFADGFGLRNVCLVGFEQVESHDPAIEFEGEEGGCLVCGCRADVVK